jgi:hypothetical protein
MKKTGVPAAVPELAGQLDRKYESVRKMLAKLLGAVSREPIAHLRQIAATDKPSGLRLTEDEIRIVENEAKWRDRRGRKSGCGPTEPGKHIGCTAAEPGRAA